MNEMLHRLAQIEPGELPFLSIYLDIRPEATGEKPAVRAGLVVLKNRLNAIRKTLPPRGPALASFDVDAARIETFIAEVKDRSTEGLAIFACDGRSIFETVQVGAPFDNQVTADKAPDLFQLARFDDEWETAVVAVVDSNTVRFIVKRDAISTEKLGPDRKPFQRSVGGWTESRQRRRLDNQREDFAAEAAASLTELVSKIDARHIVLAGDPPTVDAIRSALTPQTAALVRETIRMEIRAGRDEVSAELRTILQRIEEEEGTGVVKHLVAELQRGRLAATGPADVRRALEAGQVDTLVLDDVHATDAGGRAELVRLAANTGARVEVVSGDPAMEPFGGAGAILRFAIRQK
jgi:hypothetical protein